MLEILQAFNTLPGPAKFFLGVLAYAAAYVLVRPLTKLADKFEAEADRARAEAESLRRRGRD